VKNSRKLVVPTSDLVFIGERKDGRFFEEVD